MYFSVCVQAITVLIKLYHSRTNKVAIECREFAVAKKAIKPDFMCFVVDVGEDDNIYRSS